MKIIRPIAITEANLYSSNVLESPSNEYDPAYTYDVADYVGITTGTTVALYQSLQTANTGNAPASSPLWWQSVGSTYVLFDPLAVYARGDRIVDLATHHVFESMVDGNSGQSLLDPAWWGDAGSSNRWAMFDAVNGTITQRPEYFQTIIVPTSSFDSLALLGLQGRSVRVTITDATDGVVYDQTFDLTSGAVVDNWYDWFFSEVHQIGDLTIYGLPPYAGAQFRVIVNAPGGVAMCGTMVLGLSREIGGVSYGAQVGITDYSRKVTDDFGNMSVVQRAFAKRGSFKATIDNSDLDDIVRLLATYRAVPLVWDATDGIYGSGLMFGFYKSFNVEISYPTVSFCTLELEGLT